MGEILGLGLSTSIDKITVTLCLLIVFTMIFEMLLAKLEAALAVPYLEMLRGIYKELMIMGFISFLVFMSVESGVAGHGEYFYAFEFSHILIFFVALGFITQSFIFMVLSAIAKSSIFEYADSRRPSDLQELYDKTNINSPLFRMSRLRLIMEFQILRELFKSIHKFRGDFDFVLYVSFGLNRDILGVTHIKITSWLSVVVLLWLNVLREEYMSFNRALHTDDYATDDHGTNYSETNDYPTLNDHGADDQPAVIVSADNHAPGGHRRLRLNDHAESPATAAPPAFDITSVGSYCHQLLGESFRMSGDPVGLVGVSEPVLTRADTAAAAGRDTTVSRLLAAAGAGPAVETTNPADVYEYIIAGWVNMLVALALLFVVRRALTRLFAGLGIWGAAGLGDGLRRAESERRQRKHKEVVDMQDLRKWARRVSHRTLSGSGHGHGAAVSFSHGDHDSGAGFDVIKRLAQQAVGAVIGDSLSEDGTGSDSSAVGGGGSSASERHSVRVAHAVAPLDSSVVKQSRVLQDGNVGGGVPAKSKSRRLGLSTVGLELQGAAGAAGVAGSRSVAHSEKELVHRDKGGEVVEFHFNKIDAAGIFPFDSPGLFLFTFEAMLLCNAIYSALFFCNYAKTLWLDRHRQPMGALMLGIIFPPIVITFIVAPVTMVMHSVIKSVSQMDPDVLCEVFEDSEELKDVVENIANRMRDVVRKLPRSLQLNGLKGLFQKFDTNHDGQISRSEFRAGLQSLNINLSDHRFRLICNAVDLDRSGDINFGEFFKFIFPTNELTRVAPRVATVEHRVSARSTHATSLRAPQRLSPIHTHPVNSPRNADSSTSATGSGLTSLPTPLSPVLSPVNSPGNADSSTSVTGSGLTILPTPSSPVPTNSSDRGSDVKSVIFM